MAEELPRLRIASCVVSGLSHPTSKIGSTTTVRVERQHQTGGVNVIRHRTDMVANEDGLILERGGGHIIQQRKIREGRERDIVQYHRVQEVEVTRGSVIHGVAISMTSIERVVAGPGPGKQSTDAAGLHVVFGGEEVEAKVDHDRIQAVHRHRWNPKPYLEEVSSMATMQKIVQGIFLTEYQRFLRWIIGTGLKNVMKGRKHIWRN